MKTVLNQSLGDFSDQEFDTIFSNYKTADERFKWKVFCDEIMAEFTNKDLEKDPLATAADLDRKDGKNAGRKQGNLTVDE